MLRVAEPKINRRAIDKTELYHNCFWNASGISTGYVLNLNSAAFMPSQGIADSQRIADQIYTQQYYLKMLIGQKADRPNVNFRWYVLKVPKQSAVNYNTWFVNNTGNVLLDDPNEDFVKVVKQGTWRPNQAALLTSGAREYTFTKRIVVPYKRLIKFGPADAATSTNDGTDLYFVLMAYDAYGALITDNIAYVQVLMELKFRDP